MSQKKVKETKRAVKKIIRNEAEMLTECHARGIYIYFELLRQTPLRERLRRAWQIITKKNPVAE